MTRIERVLYAIAAVALTASLAESSYRDGLLGEALAGPATDELQQWVLSGYGCDGTSGVIYAHEESDFPRCDRIEAPAGR